MKTCNRGALAERVAVVGGGIVGVAHAWREAAAGAEVTLFERSRRAEGASVRNFGMVWPIGQPAERREAALRSRALWDEFVCETRVWSRPSGSLHLATRGDELAVLEEFAAAGPELGYDCQMLSAAACRQRCPAASERVLGGLSSPTEMGVDPREAIATAPAWLAERHGVRIEMGVAVVEVEPPSLVTGDGRRWQFDRVTICSGADYATLYPDLFAEHGLSRCKLQMMRTAPQAGGWRIGPMVASGLTLRHYENFAICPSLEALRQRIGDESPELDRHGIHVMAAQNGLGEVVLGDSHEYGESVTPFDSEEITRLMLRELKRLIDLPDWELAARWHGVYAVQPRPGVQFTFSPVDGVTVAVATGGCGMTMSFGLADKMVHSRRGALAGAGGLS
ncbi:TIGR03364 family FAD-dependent oxidoreductase [Botrimarina sp.]|uniref:TIGR03364 family FAD-dependent oxidoreductase n=1 Tax=Botrimarina sp. TaxID=2795802 RepID=UPI0032ED7EE6